MKKRKIGFISSWAECGHAYLTKNFRDALSEKHETFIFAGQNARPGSGILQETTGIWDVPNLHLAPYPYLYIGQHKEDVGEWIKKNKIDIVFFNEMYDWPLVEYCQERAKVITYIDYFTEKWIPYFDIFDASICCAKRTYEIFKHQKQTHYVDWGIDTELFKPRDGKKCTFFHSAGWGGVNFRKCTPQVINAFYQLRKKEKVTLFLHTQTQQFPEITINQINELQKEDALQLHIGSVSWPGLYHKGKIHVAPSRLEGLGLYLPEGLSCGLPAITTNSEPMSQFVKNGYNGLLVKTTGSHARKDYGGSYYFSEHDIDETSLLEKMKILAADDKLQTTMGINARKNILKNNSFEQFSKKVIQIVESV